MVYLFDGMSDEEMEEDDDVVEDDDMGEDGDGY